jgi:CRP-like cAMP-binding protein
MGVLTGQPRTATIVAATDVECYRLDKSALQHVLDARPDLAGRFSELLTQRRIELDAVREGLSVESRAQRLQASQSEILGRSARSSGSRAEPRAGAPRELTRGRAWRRGCRRICSRPDQPFFASRKTPRFA